MRDNVPKYDYFVAHEFTTQERDDLREAIDRAFKETGLNASYADVEFRSGEHILKKIEDRILATQFGIYDITNENPNVYLELGLAKGAGKTLYIICKKGTKIGADLEGLDRIEYGSYKNLTDEIKKKILPKVSEIKKIDPNNKPDNRVRIEDREPIVIFANYKMKYYEAEYYSRNKIVLKGKEYSSPSAACKAVTKKECDGWLFWRFKDKNGNEQKLDKKRN